MTRHNIWLVAQRDYTAYVMRRRFWVSLLISPAILLAVMLIPALIQHFSSARAYAVVDHSGWLSKAIQQRIAGEDYGKLLDLAASTPPAARKGLAPVLGAIAPDAARLDEAARTALGQALAAGTPVPDAPAASAIWQHRDALVHWYSGIDPEAAAGIDRGLAIARYHLVEVPRNELESRISNGTLYAWFTLPADPLAAHAHFAYASHNLTNTDLRDWYGTRLSAIVQARRAADAGLSAAQAKLIGQAVTFDSRLVTAHGQATATPAQKAAQWLPVGYVYVLFIAIMQIAQLLMLATIEEKSNRIAEMLLAAVEPEDIMAGKTLGVACVGITLMAGWLILIIGPLVLFGGALHLGGFVAAILGGITAWNIAWLMVYFVLGFLLYAAITGAIGAAVNNIREAQPYMTPVMLFMILPLILMVPVAQDPSALWARALSYVPPLTPFMMMSRSGEPPPAIDYVLTTAILIVTVTAAMYLSGRIFRRGLLSTGAPPKLREMLSWARKSDAPAKAPSGN